MHAPVHVESSVTVRKCVKFMDFKIKFKIKEKELGLSIHYLNNMKWKKCAEMLKLSLIVFSRSLNCIYIERYLCFLLLKNFFGCLFLSIRSYSVDETKLRTCQNTRGQGWCSEGPSQVFRHLHLWRCLTLGCTHPSQTDLIRPALSRCWTKWPLEIGPSQN